MNKSIEQNYHEPVYPTKQIMDDNGLTAICHSSDDGLLHHMDGRRQGR
jgi:hypothetical protein